VKYPTVFHLIAQIFEKTGVSGVLIGGFAVNYYKVTRQTADVDFLITEDDFGKISGLLEKDGYKKDYIQEVFARFKSDRLYLMDLDFMFVDRGTLDKIINSGKEISIAGQKFIIPCVEHLIALKLHSLKHNPKLREYKDMLDIIELIKVNKVDVKGAEFKELCLKYGTEEFYQKILERF